MKTAAIIARFQTPYLHEGHVNLIEEIQELHHKLIVVLGIAPIRGSRRNPYDYFTRERMIKTAFPDVVVLPLKDHPDDHIWSSHLDALLHDTLPDQAFVLYGSRDSFAPYYHGRIDVQQLPQHGDYNATEIRAQYGHMVFDSQDFRAGIIYAYHNQYTKVHPTVDVLVFRNDKSEVLLAKKATNHKWRLVGGFADETDDDYESAALRELKEETGDIKVGPMQYEMTIKINDWRYRKELDKIITTVYSCDYISGDPQAQDDIIETGWIRLKELPELIQKGKTSPEHNGIFERLIEKYL